MKRELTCLTTLLVLFVAAAVRGQDDGAEAAGEFQPIFDGKTLNGWEGDPLRWSVEDGAITGRTTADNPLRQNSFLVWKGGDVDNFVLRLKFRIENGNSGIQYRSRVVDEDKWVVGGYQADIDATGRYMGILYDERGRGILAERGQRVVLAREDGELQKEVESIGDAQELMEGIDPTEWHDYEITARGNRFTHKIDGRTMVEVVDRDRAERERSGVLAFQIHTGPPMVVQFRDIELRKLELRRRRGDNRQRDGARNASIRAPEPELSLLPGFQAELLYTVPGDQQGSWVSLTIDPKGRLIASDQYGKLYRITLSSPPPPGRGKGTGGGGEPPPVKSAVHVEPLAIDIGMAQGLLCAFDSLYVMVNNHGGQRPSGLYRVRDTDGDDQYDSVELLRELRGGGEHGPHAVVLSPNGKSLYICAGNHTDLPEVEKSRVPRKWSEDHLLPRMWDARGHARGKLAPGGWVAKTDPEGKEFELVSIGYRNEYDIAFNQVGELFTFDADMEWDVGSPWYRPTRVCHVVSGSEFGWRSGTGKWPSYYPDTLPAVVDIGPGSPTGITFGTGAKFPEKYQRALYLCDWSYGIIYAAHLEPDGASYRGTFEQFISAAPLPATDIVINPHDGAMYFAVGGRRAQSALYRVTYAGDESTEPAPPPAVNDDVKWATQMRRELEALHSPDAEKSSFDPLDFLDDHDRFVRYAARIALEHRPVESWRRSAFASRAAAGTANAMIALARCGQSSDLPEIVRSLARTDWTQISKQDRLAILRAYALAFVRLGPPDEETRQIALAALDHHYPSRIRWSRDEKEVNQELCQVLVYLGAPNVVRRTLDILAAAPTQQEQIHYAFSLRPLTEGWTLEERKEFLAWFHKAAATRGGMSYGGFINNIRDEAIQAMTDRERAQLKEEIARVPRPVAPTAQFEARRKVKEWTVQELASTVASMDGGRSYEQGRRMFAVAQCFRCHRVAGEGDTIGPDLTGVAGRFNAEDLLSSIIEPNKVISDQYQQTTFVVNGRTITGRVVNVHGNGMSVMTNMYDQSDLANINRRDIEEQRPADTSAMPSGLLDTLTEDEILDLMAYLIAGGDPDHPLFQ